MILKHIFLFQLITRIPDITKNSQKGLSGICARNLSKAFSFNN